jgi:hypothetical protein
MMRHNPRGFLSGNVGVPEGHPLFGWDHAAIPDDLGIEVHGGLTYSRICQEGPGPQRTLVSEVRRICHVVVGVLPLEHATGYCAHPGQWWFGFECDHVYDVVPGERSGRQRSDGSESMHDLFGGDMLFWRLHMCWLAPIGMLGASSPLGVHGSPLEGRLTPKGMSVLMMLRATRDPAWEELPMAEVLDAVASALHRPDGDLREQALQAFERSIGLRRHVFARERVGRSHLVTLTGFATGPGARMPTRRVTWSQAFTDVAARDHLFAWLATRVDRWDDWGEMAFGRGADAFGRHLLGLLVASGVHCPPS